MTQKLSDLAAAEERRQTVRDAAATFLRREWSLARFREAFESESTYAPALWAEMRALGWHEIEPSGEELGAAELCAIVEQTGFAMAPTPLVASVCGRVALRDVSAVLPVLAHAEAARSTELLRTSVTAQRTETGYRLDGEKRFVAYGLQADVLGVSASHAGELALFALPSETPGVTREPLVLLDGTPCVSLRLEGVHVDRGACVAQGAAAATQLEDALALQTVAHCAELVGIGARALELGVEYAKERTAFGRPIGSFQAVQHKLVNLRASLEIARALYQGAAAQIDARGAGRSAAVAMAAFAALDDLRKVPEGVLQVFGGIGTTWEHDIQFFVRRAATLCSFLGERARFRADVMSHVLGDARSAEGDHDE